ncbi:MAG: hypothetical protein LBC18_09470 [Opitutaceae bacterium]|jgi:hypothetical protein|nr:hypothetical protein [Opitutaceae bacterium]
MGVRNPQISAKIDERMVQVLSRIKSETGVSEVEMLRALLNALCRHYEKFHSITLPIVLNADAAPLHAKPPAAPETETPPRRKKDSAPAEKNRAPQAAAPPF